MPFRNQFRLVPLAVLVFAWPAAAEHVQHGLRVPDGFEVSEFADNKLANDIFHLTLDPKGRVVVSGGGYLRLLLDEKGEGKATRAVDLLPNLKDGAQGVLWEGDTLYYVADGGLHRCRITDDKAGTPELIRAVRTGGEHDAHAVKRGPDGWLYLLAGNYGKYQEKPARLPTSPVRRDVVAGYVLRLAPDLKDHEVVADGFRNAYDMDWNLDGELFTFDSDNERCVALPWYEPTRFYHVIPGSHYGWEAPQHGVFWRKPPYLPDVVAPILTLGRGSPTGVACYRHVQFPEPYRGGFFLADWTFGRIYFVKLKRSGSTYTCEKQVFLEAVGEEGFAPTALAVHPTTGDLYISVGGRGTRGAVYRVRYTEGAKKIDAKELAKMQLPKRSLHWEPVATKKLLEQAMNAPAPERLAALIEISRNQKHFLAGEIGAVTNANRDSKDAGIYRVTTFGLGLDYRANNEAAGVVAAVLQLKKVGGGKPAELLRLLRLMQLYLSDIGSPKSKGTVWEGYTPRDNPSEDARTEALKVCRGIFPSDDANLDRELTRTLAMLEDEEPVTLTRVAARLTEKSSPIEDFHYLVVLSRLKAARPENITKQTAAALLALDRKYTKGGIIRDSHWPLRMSELHVELARKDPKLNAALLANAEFGRPDHALFAQTPGFDQAKAAAVFLARAQKEKDFVWNPALVELVGSLPAEQSFPVLRKLWNEAGLDEPILTVLAKQPQAGDRDKFLQGLNSPQIATIGHCLDALQNLSGATDETHLLALVQALRRLGDSKEEKVLQERLGKYLAKLTGQEKFGSDKKAWSEWLGGKYPKLAARLGGPDGVDVAAWSRRLGKIDWTTGDAKRGEGIFTKASCISCHSGTRALGPDLRGVANRFSRDDLLTAIIQPSKDISPRYRTTVIETAEGKVYQGLIIYDAPDSILLQTGPAATVRLVNKQITGRRFSDISLMPAGLMDMLRDQEIADLLAYLKSLGNASPKAP